MLDTGRNKKFWTADGLADKLMHFCFYSHLTSIVPGNRRYVNSRHGAPGVFRWGAVGSRAARGSKGAHPVTPCKRAIRGYFCAFDHLVDEKGCR